MVCVNTSDVRKKRVDEDGQRQESMGTVCNFVILLKTTADKASACVYIHLSAVGAALCEMHSYSHRVKL